MQSLGIGTIILHVSQYSLLKETLRHVLAVLLLAEVTGVEALGTMIDADVHDIVVVDILHLHPIFVVGPFHHLIFRGIDGHVPVVSLAIIVDRGVFLHLMGVGEHRGRIVDEMDIVGVIALLQLHHVAILILEPEEVLRLLDDAIFRT